MKKRLTRILAVYLSLAVLLSSALMPEIFAQDLNDAYNAHLMDFYRSSASGTNLNVSNERDDTTLSGIKGPTVTYNWLGATTTNNSSDYLYAESGTMVDDGDKIGEIPFRSDKYVDKDGNILGEIKNGELIDEDGNPRGTYNNANGKFYFDGKDAVAGSVAYEVKATDAVMFYVKMNPQAPQTEFYFQVATAGMAVHTDSFGKKTLYPAVESKQWLMLSQNVSVYLLEKGYNQWTETKTVKSTVDSSRGNLVLPAGFEGWVRIPVSALSSKEGMSLYAYRFNFYPKQAGGKYTEDGVKIGSFMFVEDGDKAHLKVSVKEAEETARIADLVRNRPHSEVTMPELTNVTNGQSVANETHIANGYTYKLSDTSANLTFNASGSLDADGGILLYYKQPIDKDGSIKLMVGTAAAKNNADIYTISRGKSKWTKATTGATGEISVNKGFEGYIYVPAESLSGAAGKSISEISLSNLTKDACVGTVLMVESFDETSIELKFKDQANYINLFESAYYNATVIETEDKVTSTETNKNYYNVSDKVNDSAYSAGIDNGYYYEVSTGSAAEGTTKPELLKIPPFSAYVTNQIGTDFRFRTGVSKQPSGTYTNEWIKASKLTDATHPFTSPVLNLQAVPSTVATPDNITITDGAVTHTSVEDNGFYVSPIFETKLSLTSSSAFMFYIQNTGSVDTLAYIRLGQASGSKTNYYDLQKNSTYSMLKDGTAKWTDCTVEVSASGNRGNLVIPANFCGWVKISISNFKMKDEILTGGELGNFQYYPIHIGGKYGQINLSHFMTVDEGSKQYYSIKDGSTEKSLLVSADGNAYTSIVVTKNTSQKENPVVRPKGSVLKATELTDLATPLGNQWGMHINAGTEKYYTDKPYILDNNLRYFAGLFNNVQDSNGQDIILGPNSSVLVYVDHSDATKSIYTAFGIGSGWYYTRADKKYYRMADDSVNWVEGTAVVLNNEGNEKNFGFVEIPAGFKGWIRIPASSVSTISGSSLKDITASTTLKQERINIYPNAMGKEYGTLKVGGIRVLAENDNRLYIADQGTDTKAPLMNGLDLKVEKPTYDVTIGNFLGDKNFTTTAPAGEIYSTIALKSDKVINTGDALMFYAAQNGTVQSTFALGLNDFEWSMVAGAKYAIYSSKTQYWNTTSAGEDGKITLPAGFSGWIRIPYSSFTDKEKNPADAEITVSKINFTPYTLGGAWGNLQLGTFMITDNGSEDLDTMRVDKGNEQPLTKAKSYTGTTLALGSMYPAGENARTMSVKEIDYALLSGTSTFTVSAVGDAIEADLTSAIEIDLLEEASIGKDGALLFYVELKGNKDNALIFGEELLVKKDATYFTLSEGNSANWKQNSTQEEGILPIPAGFKGYVRIPADSFEVLPESFKKFVFGFKYVGGEYNTPAFGTFIVTDNGAYNYSNIYLNGSAASTSLIIPDHLEGYVLQGTASNRDDDKTNPKLTVSKLENILTPQILAGYAYKAQPTGQPVSLVDKETNPRLTFVVDDIYKSEMDSAGGLMFYVSLPEGKSNRVFVQAQGDNYARLSQGSEFWILSEGDAYWTKRAANVYNELPLPEGFKGWVRLAAADLVTSANAPLAGALSQINLSWRHIGGDWGEPEFGTFVMLNRNAESGKLSLRGMDDLNIYGTGMPTEYTEDGIAIWESVTAPFDGYADGDTYGSGTTTVDKGKEKDEPTSEFNYKVISGIPASSDTTVTVDGKETGKYLNPFNSRGIEFTSTKAISLHDGHNPRFTFSHPFTLKDSKGIVLYVNLPETPEEVSNQLFVQLYSASGKTTTVRYRKTISTLADGTKDWKNVTVGNQCINLPSGFEGYVYIPLEALETTKNANKVNRTLNEFDEVYRMVLAFGHFGGSDEDGTLTESGKAYLGGMWLNKNGVLSHDGAYVDGATDCRNVFTGEKVSEDSVRYDPFEKPAEEGWIFETLPEATDEDMMIMISESSGHSATVEWDKYEGADGYRLDMYQITAVANGSFEEVYFTYLGSYSTTENFYTLEGLLPNTYYTVYVVATKDGKGLATYSPLSVYTESQIVGDMLGYRFDPFEYAWVTYEDPEADDEQQWTDTTEDEEKTYLKKVIRRRKKKSNNMALLITVIVVASVVVVGGATVLTLILIKKKKQKAAETLNTEAGEDDIS